MKISSCERGMNDHLDDDSKIPKILILLLSGKWNLQLRKMLHASVYSKTGGELKPTS